MDDQLARLDLGEEGEDGAPGEGDHGRPRVRRDGTEERACKLHGFEFFEGIVCEFQAKALEAG